jgi:hypothetical protein
VSRSSEGDQAGGSWWLNDGKHGGTVAAKGWRREKGLSTRGGLLLLYPVEAVGKGSVSCGRSGGGGETVGTAKRW